MIKANILVKTDTLKTIWYFFKPYKVRSVILVIAMTVSGLLETLNMAAL